jgi:hypothetical protein
VLNVLNAEIGGKPVSPNPENIYVVVFVILHINRIED